MSPTQFKSDFVKVRLSDAGRAFAGEKGTVRVANAHMDYKFSGNEAVRVLTSEWAKLLSSEIFQGKPILEVVPDAPVATAPATPAKSKELQSAPQSVAVATQENTDAAH